MPHKPPILDIGIEAAGWRRVPKLKSRLEAAAVATLAHLPGRLQFPCTVNLLLTSDAAMEKLNRDFRGVARPTNVLSFPQFGVSDLPKKGKIREPVPVGDIVMAYQYIVAEAKKHNKLLINHAVHLLIHGILHLFGYDHNSDKDAARMEKLEKRIMADLKLPDPYVFPAAAPRKK